MESLLTNLADRFPGNPIRAATMILVFIRVDRRSSAAKYLCLTMPRTNEKRKD
jgi:hypothetical protein